MNVKTEIREALPIGVRCRQMWKRLGMALRYGAPPFAVILAVLAGFASLFGAFAWLVAEGHPWGALGVIVGALAAACLVFGWVEAEP